MIITGSMRGDTKEALKLWEECSRAGHGWAKANLAKVLVEGRIIEQDVERASRLYEEAWNCDTPLSETHAHTSALNLADLFLNHMNRPKDAVFWLHRAADDAHDILAQYQLGHAYSYGKFGLPVDLEKARYYTQRAADGNLVLAQHNLGCLLYEGEKDTPSTLSSETSDTSGSTSTEAANNENEKNPDFVGAAYYFARAHQQEYYWSTLNLANMYAAGKGVPQNFTTAKVLIQEVKEFGVEAQQKAAEDVLNNVLRIENGEEVKDAPLQMRRQPNEKNPSSPLNIGL